MNITIVRRPLGEAPDWVRDAWIELSLPLAVDRQLTQRTLGVLSGPDSALLQLWALLSGKGIKTAGYAVNAKAAVDCLAESHPEAAAWWRERTPRLLDGTRCFVFDAEACEREEGNR